MEGGGVLCWVPYHKGILLFGAVYFRGPPIVVNPPLLHAMIDFDELDRLDPAATLRWGLTSAEVQAWASSTWDKQSSGAGQETCSTSGIQGLVHISSI